MPSITAIRRQQGAALLILLTLIGLGMATLFVNAFNTKSRETERENRTLQSLATAREALLGYAASNGRLPRPASSAENGHENPALCTSPDTCTGYIPWVTLGIEGTDSWGNLLRYSVTPAYAAGPVDPLALAGDKRILGRRDNGKSFYLLGTEDCTRQDLCSPAIIVSTAKNGPGTGLSGVTRASATTFNIDERHNFIATNDFVSRTRSVDATAVGGEYDDLITSIPIKLLYSRMSAAGVLH